MSISAFLLQLVCADGLISETEVEASYRHISTGILDKLPTARGDVGARLLDEKQGEFEIVAVEGACLQEQGEISTARRETPVPGGVPAGAGRDPVSHHQRYTKAAQHPRLTAESGYRLQRSGGMRLGMVN